LVRKLPAWVTVGAPLLLAIMSVVVAGLTGAPRAPASGGGDVEVVAVGDIACDPASPEFNHGMGRSSVCQQAATYALAKRLAPDAVLALGDTQYFCGGYEAYLKSYDLSWGNLLARTYPVVGNHEYLTAPGPTSNSEGGGTGCDASNTGAVGYFKYFADAPGHGAAGQGWYSFDRGAWHLIALNSSCQKAHGCGPTSAQGKWLTADLAAHQHQCVLAYWHIPFWSSGGRAEPNSAAFVQQLAAAHADVILAGHDHIYERFAPQNAVGAADPAGLRAFVVGTGGANHTSIAAVAPNSKVRFTNTYGVLDLMLHPTGYDWSFVNTSDQVRDSGRAICHNTAQTPPPPSRSNRVRLSVRVTSSGKKLALGHAAKVTVSVANRTAATIPESHLEIALSSGLATTAPKGADCFAGGPIECAVHAVEAHRSVTVSLSVRATKAGQQTVRATTSPGEPINGSGRSNSLRLAVTAATGSP
jgi:calcineurin-like phosphoesterase family protein